MPSLTNLEERLSVPVTRATADELRRRARAEEISLGALLRRAIRRLLADEDERRERERSGP